MNHAYLCLNHCLEQLIKFCEDALFADADEEQAIRKLYKKFGYPIVPLSIETNNLLHFIKNEKTNLSEVYLRVESSTAEKVHYYVYHLKSLLKTSDQQHITTVSDLDDALLQFSSFVSNGKSIDFFKERVIIFPNRICAKNGTYIGFVDSGCQQSWRDLCDNNLVLMVLLSKTIARFIRLKYTTKHLQSSWTIAKEYWFDVLSLIKSSFVADIMNSGLMLCIEPDWMNTLYDHHFEEFNIFEDLSEQFKMVLHQMLNGMGRNSIEISSSFGLSLF